MEINMSDIVLSTNGRDADKFFMVIAADGGYLLLADGRGRRIEKPKRKKAKHTRLIGTSEGTRVAEKLLRGEKITNAELRKELLNYSSDTEGGMPVG
ncbi:MAG: hypothetical protein GX823_07000 [Clostridiales bacterium]|nr:hypothetical protein [Clostridiales bacterium]